MVLEPSSMDVRRRTEPVAQRPEIGPVVHFDQVCDLMGGNVVEDLGRRHDQPKGEHEVALGGTAAPTRARIAEGELSRVAPDRVGMLRDRRAEPVACHRRQERLDPRALTRVIRYDDAAICKTRRAPGPRGDRPWNAANGRSAPIRAMLGAGARSRWPRTQSARSCRNARASSSGAQTGRLIDTRPSLRETRREKRLARLDRRSTTSIGGSPGRTWVDVPCLRDTRCLRHRVASAVLRARDAGSCGKGFDRPPQYGRWPQFSR
jgi:hypothetical protein